MKGILLAGGSGTRLYPSTVAVNKHLLPVYDKPLIYYSLSILMLAGIREVLLVTNPGDLGAFRRLLRDGSQWGLSISYAHQESPRGIPEALLIGREFLDGGGCCLVLGDNVLYAAQLPAMLRTAAARTAGASVFGYAVKDPERYGVIAFDEDGRPTDIVEKPQSPPSPYAVPGVYFYDAQAPDAAARLQPSARGELEITDLNRWYLRRGELAVDLLGRGAAWLDAGTAPAMLSAANFVATIEQRQGMLIACLEEIALRLGWLDADGLGELPDLPERSAYGMYVTSVLQDLRHRSSR